MALRDYLGRLVQRSGLLREHSAPELVGPRSMQADTGSVIEPGELGVILRQSERPGYGHARRYVELAERMEETYLHYSGVISTRKRQVSQIPIVIEPATDAAQDVADAELVRQFVGRDEFPSEVIDLLDAIAKSYAVCEIIWETSERQWMPVRLEHRLPQWFDFDRETGKRLMLHDWHDGGLTELAPYKYVCHKGAAKSGLPVRSGLARPAAWAWMAQQYTISNWMRFCEAYGQPIRIGKYGPHASPEDRRTLWRALRSLATDAAAMLPEGMSIEFDGDQQAAARAEIFENLAQYTNRQVSIAVLGQTLTTESGDSGSYALGQVHNLVRADIEQADARLLSATLQRDIVVPMITLNHGQRDRYPKVVVKREQAQDAKMIADALAILVPLGLRVRQDEVRRILALSPPDDDDEVLTAPASIAPQPAAARLAMARTSQQQVDEDEALARYIDDDWQRLTQPMIQPILDAAADAASYDDLRSAFPDVLADMDDAAISTLLARLSFSAHVSEAL